MSILVVGAIHHDVIVETPVIPREDETVPGTGVRYSFGGKGGNQALAAARLGNHAGVAVALAACVGNDDPGDNALATLRHAGVDTAQIQRVATPSGMSVALSLPNGGYGAVIVSASNLELHASKLVLPSDLQWLVLQNELPESVNLDVAARAKRKGAKVLLNAAPARAMTAESLALVDVLVVNTIEAADLLGLSDDALDGEMAVHKLAEHHETDVVLTLGGEGAWVSEGKQAKIPIAGHDVRVVSTHGAGDAFIGALVVRLYRGTNLIEAARFANAAAALHVSTPVDERSAIGLDAIQTLAQTSSL